MSANDEKMTASDKAGVGALLVLFACLFYWLVTKVLDAVLPGFWSIVGITVVFTLLAVKFKSWQKIGGAVWLAAIAAILYKVLKTPVNLVVICVAVLAAVVFVASFFASFKESESSATT